MGQVCDIDDRAEVLHCDRMGLFTMTNKKMLQVKSDINIKRTSIHYSVLRETQFFLND